MNSSTPLNTDQSITSVKLLANVVRVLYEDVFKRDIDYGVIPGTGTKPALLLPGMEKLMRALQLRPDYITRQSIIDFETPLFFFQYECRLAEIETGLVVSSAIGSANSHESKWRWRNAERVCPVCGKAAIIKGKAEYGGGWLCFAKKGGCGAKFGDAEPAIAEQQVSRIENPDIADQLNTIDKIAQKRALASAIKGAANVSELFTVDVDDLVSYAVDNGYAAPPQLPSSVDTITGEIVAPTPPSAPAPAPTPPTDDVFADLPQIEPPELVPAASGTWTKSQADSFSLECKRANVSVDEALALLNVSRLSEYAPGFTAARAELRKYLSARPAPQDNALDIAF